MPWAQFIQIHTGGDREYLPFHSAFIEADEATARRLFMEAFSQHPDHVACDCCGHNWGVIEWDTLEEATAMERNEPSEEISQRPDDPVMSFEDFLRDPHWIDFGRRRDVVLMYANGKVVLPLPISR